MQGMTMIALRQDGRRADQLRPIRFSKRHRSLRHRLDADRMGQYARALRRDDRGFRAALDEGTENVTGGWITAEYSMASLIRR